MGQESSLYRTVNILKELNSGKTLCINKLALEYDVSERTIHRDFKLIKEVFGDFFTKNGLGCYKGHKKVVLEELLSASEVMVLANIKTLFGFTSMQNVISKDTKALIEKSLKIYDFKTRPYEQMKQQEVIKTLEHSINFKKEIKIKYKVSGGKIEKKFLPYKLLFLNENFYLVGENSSKRRFEFLRISMILEVELINKIFLKDIEVEDFIKTIQTPWAIFNKPTIEIKIKANKSVAKYFELKKYLPSQEIKNRFDDGSLEIEYRVTSFREVEELIIKWLPLIEIISPKKLNKVIKSTLEKKLNSLS